MLCKPYEINKTVKCQEPKGLIKQLDPDQTTGGNLLFDIAECNLRVFHLICVIPSYMVGKIRN